MSPPDSSVDTPAPHYRALSRPECQQLLAGGGVGRVVVTLPSNAVPVIRPVNYAFDPAHNAVVFRTMAGSKLFALLRSRIAWFEVDHFDPARGEAWSVIVSGAVEEVTRADDIQRVERLGLVSWAGGDKARWMRIHARTVSGRHVYAPQQ